MIKKSHLYAKIGFPSNALAQLAVYQHVSILQHGKF